MTTPSETTFAIVMRLAPRDYRETRDPKNRFRMICPVCNYVPRGGGFTAFSIHEDRNRWACFACGNHGGPKDMLGHLGGSEPLQIKSPQDISRPAGKETRRAKLPGATLKELCQAKGLDEQWCRQVLGWRDGNWYKTRAVEMPYFTELGVEATIRYRVGITGEERFRSRGKQILYGLWALAHIRELGWAIIVEGETDFAVLYYCGYPALGVPGASLWKDEHARLLRGVQIYLWRELDTGGNTLFTKVTTSVLNPPKVIYAPLEGKDPCELAQVCGSRFQAVMDQLLAEARPDQAPPVDHINRLLRSGVRASALADLSAPPPRRSAQDIRGVNER